MFIIEMAYDRQKERVGVFTFSQNLGDLGVAGTESTVDLEAIGVVQKGTAQGEQHLLMKQENTEMEIIILYFFNFDWWIKTVP